MFIWSIIHSDLNCLVSHCLKSSLPHAHEDNESFCATESMLAYRAGSGGEWQAHRGPSCAGERQC